VWECDPTGEAQAISRPAMGLFSHEAVAVDPVGEALYMTEDDSAGSLYRFTPAAYPDLSEGTLEAAIVADDGSVTWGLVDDPSGASVRTNAQVEEATPFIGGEGIWYHDGWIYFTTKSDDKVHAVDLVNRQYETIYEANPDDVDAGTAVLSGVDNITVDASTGDLFVAEDGGNMEVVIITPEGEVAPFLRVVGHDDSELTGPTFNPRRDRFYFSSQRAPSPKTIGEIVPEIDNDDRLGGMTIEISGPFRGAQAPPETTTIQSPTTTLAHAGSTDDDDDGGGGGNGAVIGIGAGVAAAVVAGGAFVALRNRRASADTGPGAETEADDTPT
jgi:secreted PhoX family phosphatase